MAFLFLSDATPVARLRAAVFRKDRLPHHSVYSLTCGRFCGTFSAAPARPFRAAQAIARSRPAKGCAPFDPRQGRRPCTCPDPPFLPSQGLCFPYRPAIRKQNVYLPSRGTKRSDTKSTSSSKKIPRNYQLLLGDAFALIYSGLRSARFFHGVSARTAPQSGTPYSPHFFVSRPVELPSLGVSRSRCSAQYLLSA